MGMKNGLLRVQKLLYLDTRGLKNITVIKANETKNRPNPLKIAGLACFDFIQPIAVCNLQSKTPVCYNQGVQSII